jgi:membrane protein
VPNREAALRRGRKLVDTWVDAFGKHDLLTYASAIAFHVLKSLIPLTLFAIAALGALGRQDVWEEHVAPALKPRFDPPVYRALDYGARKIFEHDSIPIVVFGALLTIWYVSGAVRGIMGGINRIYEVDEQRATWLRWSISFGLALAMVAAVCVALLLVAIVPTPGGAAGVLVALLRWAGALAALAIAAGLLVRLGPVRRRPKKWASAGAVLVIVTWFVTTLVFRWYVASIANFKTAVGQLTVFIVLMVYVYASSIVFLVGVQLDEFLREDANGDERGILAVIRGG